MNQGLMEELESRINDIVEKYSALKAENARLNEEIQRFSSERDGLRSRVDAILGKLEGL
ncbi:MAG: cell division protein ZapB [Deltaproteobacteria bacterium]|nr:cell division protein ZapB [Deltaproteobacteria bacterium]